MPHYPSYPSTPFSGPRPSMWSPLIKTYDLWPTGSTAAHYAAHMDEAARRQLAGDDEVEPPREPGLAEMESLDDASGSGIFDRGRPPNTHVGGGLFQRRLPWPGYLQREPMAQPSPDVVDVNTGRPMVYVPAGMVGLDTVAQIAMLEQNKYPIRPIIGPARNSAPVTEVDTAEWYQYPKKIDSLGEVDEVPAWQKIAAVAAVGLLAGVLYGRRS